MGPSGKEGLVILAFGAYPIVEFMAWLEITLLRKLESPARHSFVTRLVGLSCTLAGKRRRVNGCAHTHAVLEHGRLLLNEQARWEKFPANNVPGSAVHTTQQITKPTQSADFQPMRLEATPQAMHTELNGSIGSRRGT